MRTIKYKVWDTKDKIFLDEVPSMEAWIGSDSWDDPEEASLFLWTEAETFEDRLIWLEYIGLDDKDGKEIYDGDIGEVLTECGEVKRFVVEWGIHRREMASGYTVDIPSFAFMVDGFPTFPIFGNYAGGHDLDIITIVGNIYETPELIN